MHRKTGRIIQLGTENPPVSDFGAADKQDYGGQRILPGLHDSHIHVSSVGQAIMSVQLKGCKSIEEFQSRIKDYADKHPKVNFLHF